MLLPKSEIESYVQKLRATGDGSFLQQNVALIGEAHAAFDNWIKDSQLNYLDQSGAPKPFPCKTGCNYCCYLPVQVIEPEITLIAVWLWQSKGALHVKHFSEKLLEARNMIGNKKDKDRESISVPCPFLEEAKCSIYAVRPLSCRAYYSSDVGCCEEHKNHPDTGVQTPIAKGPKEMSKNLVLQIVQILSTINAPFRIYDLIEGMDAALNDPDFPKRMKSGIPGMKGPSNIFTIEYAINVPPGNVTI